MKKILTLMTALFIAVAAFAQSGVNWDDYNFLADGAGGGKYNNQFKVQKVEQINEIVNIQLPDFAKEDAIYLTTSSGISECSVGSAIQGAGIALYLSSFTAKETQVSITNAGGTFTFWVYNDKGTEGSQGGNQGGEQGGDEGDEPTEVFDVNFALTGTATSPFGNAAMAIDGNDGTRWEFPAANIENETDAYFLLDLGARKIFNTIQIVWEGAYSKSFVIEVSEDGEEYTTVVSKENEILTNFPNTKTYEIEKTTARYVKFTNQARGTIYGVSFWEFRVFNQSSQVLTSLVLSSSKTIAKVGESVTLTTTGKDQIGQTMPASGFEYEVSPADMGTVDDGKYTPTKAGEATIISKKGDIVSNAITVTSYEGEKIDIFSNWTTMVTAIYEDTATGSMVGGFDNNDGSLWELHGSTAADEASRTYTIGFSVKLTGIYNVTAIRILFEGASSADFTVKCYDLDNNVVATPYDVTGGRGMGGTVEYFTILTEENLTDRIEFVSTKAATQYGVKIFEFTVYGEKKEIVDPNPDHIIFGNVENLFVVEETNVSFKVLNRVDSEVEYDATQLSVESSNPTVAAAAIDGASVKLTAVGVGTATITLHLGEISATFEVHVYPTFTGAPVPTLDSEYVLSLYSDTYGRGTGYGWYDWGGCTLSDGEIDGNNYKKAASFAYCGSQFNALDVTGYAYFHVDVYSTKATTIGIVPITTKPEGGNSPERGTYRELEAMTWNSIDIPMSEFIEKGALNLDRLYQIKYNGKTNGADELDGDRSYDIYFDNVYFYNEPAAIEAPVFSVGTPTFSHDSETKTLTVGYSINQISAGSGVKHYTVWLVQIPSTPAGAPARAAGEETVLASVNHTDLDNLSGSLTVNDVEHGTYNYAVRAQAVMADNSVVNPTGHVAGSSAPGADDDEQVYTFDTVSGNATTSVEGVTVEASATVEYFNLQGMRVENPSNGMYIRREGNKVSKVFVR